VKERRDRQKESDKRNKTKRKFLTAKSIPAKIRN
jgi:hypothetical protein